MLKIENLSVYRGKKNIIDELSLEIGKGEIVGLVGPNGSGKSTLIKACASAVKKRSGKIWVDGIEQGDNVEKYLENIQFCYDKAPFYPQLSGFENLMQVARLYTVTKEDVYEILKVVGLQKRMNESVSKYSFGMLQRLNMAQMLLTKRKMIFLDEPLNGIDPEGVVLFRKLFKIAKEEYGCTLLISSHLLGELKSVCDRIVFMRAGKIVDDVDMGKEDKNVHIIQVDDLELLLKLLGEKYSILKISEDKISVEVVNDEFNNCISDIIQAGIKIVNIESYTDVERIYINKVGGELDE